MHLIYSADWNNKLHLMVDPIDPTEATRKLEDHQTFAIAGGPEPLTGTDFDNFLKNPDLTGNPADWAIAVDPTGPRTSFMVRFYNFWGTALAEYTFHEQPDGRLFIEQVNTWQYPDSTQYWDYFDSTSSEEWKYKPGGYSNHAIRTPQPDGSLDVLFTEYNDTDLTANWETTPAVGDWTALTDRNRFS